MFSDSYSHYQGVTGVISGGHSAQNRQKSYFLLCYLKRSPPIDVLTISNDFRHKTGIIKTNFNCFLIHRATTRGSLWSFPGDILPKIDKNHTFLLCYLKRSPPVDFLTVLNDFRHKTGIITIHFNCLLIYIATTRGSLGSFPGLILLKIDENHTFLTFCHFLFLDGQRQTG